MAHSKVIKRCCKVLDNFDRSLVLPPLFCAVNPPEKTWKNYKIWYCMPSSSEDAAPSDDSKKRKAVPGSLLQRKIPRLDSGQIQYLLVHEKDQIQDFRNWMQNDLETTTRSAPESPVIGLIENSTAISPDADTSGTSNEPNPLVPKLAPSATTEGTSSAAGIGSGGAEGSRNPAVRVVPFQSLP
ncbi:uncharacterized protein LOC120672296 [Panicum virgatum]|uniref:uncharacterized protein LOC120672296 n=1 Tax=Panicum virgatum TaxID=38727 RepID=UPI0019D67E29|nr:uncharacterized protein LOC120672296 [Panicum virgatum]